MLREQALGKTAERVIFSIFEGSREMKENELEDSRRRHDWDRETQTRPSCCENSAAGRVAIGVAEWAPLGLYAHKWIIDRHDEYAVYVLQLGAVDVAG